ncbi:hypothetical protein HSR122_1709 [Halapricum desulfuricans]|uniref:Uncharacterized protein n=1 Tax=Halapricum desulfuricans TaxID=2841257 RepID=A0A897N3Y5_9EURY|nr:hypothetical protein HSR122_1709 [Halapricum desulfuricans]
MTRTATLGVREVASKGSASVFTTVRRRGRTPSGGRSDGDDIRRRRGR